MNVKNYLLNVDILYLKLSLFFMFIFRYICWIYALWITVINSCNCEHFAKLCSELLNVYTVWMFNRGLKFCRAHTHCVEFVGLFRVSEGRGDGVYTCTLKYVSGLPQRSYESPTPGRRHCHPLQRVCKNSKPSVYSICCLA